MPIVSFVPPGGTYQKLELPDASDVPYKRGELLPLRVHPGGLALTREASFKYLWQPRLIFFGLSLLLFGIGRLTVPRRAKAVARKTAVKRVPQKETVPSHANFVQDELALDLPPAQKPKPKRTRKKKVEGEEGSMPKPKRSPLKKTENGAEGSKTTAKPRAKRSVKKKEA